MLVSYASETTLGHAIFDQADFGDVRRNVRMAEIVGHHETQSRWLTSGQARGAG